jgi:ABC-2 type transport system permease protein
MSMRSAIFIASGDLRRALRQRETLLWTFLMPLVFFYFIGTVTGGFGGGTRKQELALEVAPDAGFLAGEIERRLEQRGYSIAKPEDSGQLEKAARRLEIPADFTERVLNGEETAVHFRRKSSGLGADYDRIKVARAVYTVLADVVVSSQSGELPTKDAFARLAEAPRALTLEVKPAGKRKEVPSGFQQAVPGTMVMFTMIVLLTSGGVMLLIDRKAGLLRRLASAPISRGEMALGKWLALLALGLVQIAFAMAAGTLLFDVDWGPDFWAVCIVLVAWAALASAFAILLGSLARSEGQVVALGVLSANILAALGGCWWPIEITPSWMQKLALALPTGWTMHALHELSIFQNGPLSALGDVAALSLAALACGWLAARAFRYE